MHPKFGSELKDRSRVVQNFLGKHRAENYVELVRNMLDAFRDLGCRMSIRIVWCNQQRFDHVVLARDQSIPSGPLLPSPMLAIRSATKETKMTGNFFVPRLLAQQNADHFQVHTSAVRYHG